MTRREPTELWSSRLSLLGGKQKREQSASWWRIRIIGVEARKCRDPARKAAHRNRIFRKVQAALPLHAYQSRVPAPRQYHWLAT
jgi:hypothetical protein